MDPVPKQEEIDVPTELIHRIQSLLSLKEAARTSILSKSWLHAWSTIPTLRFQQSLMLFNKQSETKFRKLINRTILRYLGNQIPIQSFLLQIYIQNHDDSAENLIRRVAQKSNLTHLSLTIKVMIDSFTLPCDILFSGENLNKLSVVSTTFYIKSLCLSSNSNNPVMINCVSLRELELVNVLISEDLLNNLLSTCKLLQMIKLKTRLGVKKIVVKNLHCLRQLNVSSFEQSYIMEIADVPSLGSFTYDSSFVFHMKPLLINMDSLGTLTELSLGGVMINGEFFDRIQSCLPFLESLSLNLGVDWTLDSLDITCVSLKRLTVSGRKSLSHLQVFAPKLFYFCYNGGTIPHLSFPTVAPNQITLNINLWKPIGYSFLLDLRETLNLSSTFDIKILDQCRFDLLFPLDLDVDDLRRKLPLPAINVQHLSLSTLSDKRLWEDSQYFNIFFSICHPTYVDAYQFTTFKDKKCFHKVMARLAMEKKIKKGYWSDLKDVEIKDPIRGHWETLAGYSKFFPDVTTLDDWYHAQFKLTWCS